MWLGFLGVGWIWSMDLAVHTFVPGAAEAWFGDGIVQLKTLFQRSSAPNVVDRFAWMSTSTPTPTPTL